MSRSLATLWGIGYLPWAPGTWGSLTALPIGFSLVSIGGVWLLLVGIIATSAIGWWASERHIQENGQEDPGEIVIDELAGQWVALLPATLFLPDVLIAFVLFRAADIFKPWPASWADREIQGGFGVMADDLIAGVYAALGLVVIKLFLNLIGVM
jgi:phosphatidylglycerophosphatase A